MSFEFGTKAETLETLPPLVRRSTVSPLLYFAVRRWQEAKAGVVADIQQMFGDSTLVVRSSALIEDHGDQPMGLLPTPSPRPSPPTAAIWATKC